MGRPPYQAALRLVVIAQEHWAAIDGEAAQRGVDYFGLTFDRFLNAIHWWAMQRVENPKLFDEELERPLGKTPPPVTQVDLEEDEQSFLAFASVMGVRPPTPQALPSTSDT